MTKPELRIEFDRQVQKFIWAVAEAFATKHGVYAHWLTSRLKSRAIVAARREFLQELHAELQYRCILSGGYAQVRVGGKPGDGWRKMNYTKVGELVGMNHGTVMAAVLGRDYREERRIRQVKSRVRLAEHRERMDRTHAMEG